MAFISTEKVKEIRDTLKKELPNLKFSVRKEDYSKVVITIKSGDIDFISQFENIERDYFNTWHLNCDSVVNKFSDKAKESLEKISKIAFDGWYDNSDAMIDYFYNAYYVVFNIGDYEKPYILKEAKKVA